MKLYLKRVLVFFVLAACTGSLQCSKISVAGGGSDVGNGIAGKIVAVDGTGAANAMVMLLPSDYNPQTGKPAQDSLFTLTNSAGEYFFRIQKKGAYTIQAVHGTNGTRSLRALDPAQDSAEVIVDTLKIPGVVKVILSEGMDLVNGSVYIPGTTISSPLAGSHGFVILDSVPAGIIAQVSYSSNLGSLTKPLRFRVAVSSADTTAIRNFAWKYSQTLYLNTTANGAAVSGNVYGFPVLIRLNASCFDFSSSGSNGRDIMFTKVDNSALSFDVERYDSSAQLAEVWVRVDTVFGNNRTQTITMYWGAQTASTSSANAATAVFDSSNFFQGVWHLSGDCSDATGKNSGDGTLITAAPGYIGIGQKFSANSSIKIPGLLGMPQNVTLSAWANLDSENSWGSEIVSLGNAALLRMDDSALGTAGVYCFNAAGIADSAYPYTPTPSNKFLKATSWHYLVYSIDSLNSVQKLFIDGDSAAVSTKGFPINYSGSGINTYIGQHGNGKTGFNFIGIIDEVRVDKTARSKDWIRLCYMNQRVDDKLVILK